MRLLVGDRSRPHTRQLEKFTDVLLGLLDARMPFPAYLQGRLEDCDRRGDRGRVALQHIGERVSFRLAGQDGDDRGCIDENYAFPLSSSWNALSASRPVAGRLSTRC